MKKTLVALTAVTAMALTACGGGSDRPSKDELVEALKNEDNVVGSSLQSLDDEQLDCVAETMLDSDMSDDTLQAIVDNDEDYEGSDKEEKALEAAQEDMKKCVTG